MGPSFPHRRLFALLAVATLIATACGGPAASPAAPSAPAASSPAASAPAEETAAGSPAESAPAEGTPEGSPAETAAGEATDAASAEATPATGAECAADAAVVDFWTSHTPPDLGVLETIVTDFNQANPDICVRMRPVPGIETNIVKLLTALRGGVAHDV